ncbi:hypothetical protein [Nocardia vinacea]|uniref:hypothetical protein n=1 Tax=Nocardia vinacea TaxID=96468 RepID=UPI0003139F0C|nr:hypothetical protein [Nocardia vinacea]
MARLIGRAGLPLGATKATSGNDPVADSASDRDGCPAEQLGSGTYHRRRSGDGIGHILGGLLGSSGKNIGIRGAIGEALAGNADGALARTFVGEHGTITAAVPAALCVTARWANDSRPIAINPLLRAEPLHSVWLSNADVGV